MADDNHQPEGLVQKWAEAFAQAKETSPELTWRAGCAAINAAQEAAGGPGGFGSIVDKALHDLPDTEKTWSGARKALQNLITQANAMSTSKVPDTRELRVRTIQSALDALNHEMQVSQARMLQR